MRCPICESNMTDGKTTLTFKRGHDHTIVVKEIPAQICSQCGESFIDLSISEQVETFIHKAENNGLKMGFLEFHPAA